MNGKDGGAKILGRAAKHCWGVKMAYRAAYLNEIINKLKTKNVTTPFTQDPDILLRISCAARRAGWFTIRARDAGLEACNEACNGAAGFVATFYPTPSYDIPRATPFSTHVFVSLLHPLRQGLIHSGRVQLLQLGVPRLKHAWRG